MLNDYIEFAEEDLLHHLPLAPRHGTVIWLKRSVLLLASVAAVGSSIGCNSNQPQIDDLQFQKGGKILEAKTVSAGQSYGWGSVDLGTVPDIPLVAKAPPGGGNFNLFNLWYQTPVYSTEVDLFALDPSSLADTMTNMLPIVEMATGSDQMWALLVQSEPYNPPAAAIPFPAPPGLAPLPPLTVALSTSLFLAPGAQPLLGDASNPSGTGSVKAARIYDHGSCSSFQPALPVYQQIFSTFDKYYACAFDNAGATPQRTYSHLATQLRNTQNDPTNPSDGFVFDGYYGAGVPVYSNITIFFNQAYFFYASDGLVQVQAGKTFLSVNGHNSDQVFGTMKGVLNGWGAPDNSDESVAKQLNSFIENQQTRDLFGGNPVFACKAGGVVSDGLTTALQHAYQSDCQDAINALGFAIDSGAPKLQLSPQETKALKNSLGAKWPYDDGKGPYWSYWRCVPRPPGSTPANQCEFTVPAKRLNVYPDGLELVWFDGKELNNAAYALYVASFANGAPKGATQKLCSFTQVQPSPAPSYNRPFASLSEGKASGLGGFGVGCP